MVDDSTLYTLVYVVKTNTRDSNDYLSVGSIFCFALNEGMRDLISKGDYLLCDGAELKTEDYPELYRVMGNNYEPEYLSDDTSFRKFLRKLGFKIPVKKRKNPNYREGYFRLPDLKGQFVLDRDQMHINSKIITE